MLCARVIRGSSSRAKEVIFWSRILATLSRLRFAFIKATTTVPGRIAVVSSAVGIWTFTITSAPPSRAARLVSSFAPAWEYAVSGYRELSPAPASTTTS